MTLNLTFFNWPRSNVNIPIERTYIASYFNRIVFSLFITTYWKIRHDKFELENWGQLRIKKWRDLRHPAENAWFSIEFFNQGISYPATRVFPKCNTHSYIHYTAIQRDADHKKFRTELAFITSQALPDAHSPSIRTVRAGRLCLICCARRDSRALYHDGDKHVPD